MIYFDSKVSVDEDCQILLRIVHNIEFFKVDEYKDPGMFVDLNIKVFPVCITCTMVVNYTPKHHLLF